MGGGNLTIGNNVGMSSPTIWCDEKIVIGNDVRIGALVTILDTDCHSLNYVDRMNGDKNTKTMPVVIEDGVLIGAQSLCLKEVILELVQLLEQVLLFVVISLLTVLLQEIHVSL